MVKLMEHAAIATIAVREGGIKSIGLFVDSASTSSRGSPLKDMYFQNMSGTDSETGEFVAFTNYPSDVPAPAVFDLETGEPDTSDVTTIKLRKTRFNVPKNLLAQEPALKCCIDPNENFTLSKKEQVMNLQEEIIKGYNKTSHRLYFVIITTLTIFTRVFVLLAILTEVTMHAWAHKKNNRNSNPTIYYRSPLHVFTSQFCLYCRTESNMEEVIKLQDKRHQNWQLHLKDMARTIY